MTKLEALSLPSGTRVFVVDDTRGSMFDALGSENSPLVHKGLQIAVIGKLGRYGRPVDINPFSGYLVNFADSRKNVPPEQFFLTHAEALAEFEAYVGLMCDSLARIIAKFRMRVDEARAMAPVRVDAQESGPASIIIESPDIEVAKTMARANDSSMAKTFDAMDAGLGTVVRGMASVPRFGVR